MTRVWWRPESPDSVKREGNVEIVGESVRKLVIRWSPEVGVNP